MNKIKKLLENELKSTIKEIYSVDLEKISLENPPKKNLGDFAFGCFVLSKETKKNPAMIAGEIAQKIIESDLILEANPTGPYLNIKLSYDFYTEILKNQDNSELNIGAGEKLVVDYIGPNVGKPMHIGHMCTPNQGQVTVNLAKKLGYDVISDSHIGDWGIIFGKLITAFKFWGDESKLKENAVDYLLELYVKITAEIEAQSKTGESSLEEETRLAFKKLSEGEEEYIKIWESFTKESIKAMQIMLKRLGVEVQYNIGESFYEGLNLPKMEDYPDLKYSMSDIVKELIQKGIATQNEDGSVGVVFPEGSKIPSCILQKNNGTHGYLASDLACVKYRMENWNPSKIIYHVDVRQQLHLQQVFEISKLAGWLNKDTELFHAYNGFISLKDGAMSTRHGNIIKLESLLNEAVSRAKNIIVEKRDDLEEDELNKIAEIIGIGAIKYGYLSKSRTTDMIFDWDEFMTFEGNSGPYISYNYVRANSLFKKAEIDENMIELSHDSSFTSQDEVHLFKMICEYDEILLETFDKKLPHILAGYTYNLTKAFSSFYNNISILSEEDENNRALRLKLVSLYKKTIKDAFDILAIQLPEKM